MPQQLSNLRRELIDYEEHNDSHLRWIVFGIVVAISLLSLLIWLLLRGICTEVWYIKLLGLQTSCKTNVAVANLPNAGKTTQKLEINGKELTLSDGGGTVVLNLEGLEGPAGSAGINGSKGVTGSTGATGAAGTPAPPGGGTLDQAYNFGGPAAGRVINATGANQPVSIHTPAPLFSLNFGIEVTGDGGAGNSTAAGLAIARLNFGTPTAETALVYSGNLPSFLTGNFGFHSYDDTVGAENHSIGLLSPSFDIYGALNFNVLGGASLAAGNFTTGPVGDGLELSLSSGNGGAGSGNGGNVNINSGNAPTDGNGGQINFQTGIGSGPTGIGGNFNMFANNGDLDGGSMNFNTGSGGTGNGGNVGFGMGSGGNDGGQFFATGGNGGNNGGGFGFNGGSAGSGFGGSLSFNGGSSTSGSGGGINFSGGDGPSGGGSFNFNAGSDPSNTNNGGGVNLNAGTGANGGGFNFNGGIGTINGGQVNLNGGTGLNGGGISLNAGNGDFSGADTPGSIYMNAGDGLGNPGHIGLFAGDSGLSSGGTVGLFGGAGTDGGALNLNGGNANFGGNGNGGSIVLTAGQADGLGSSGDVNIASGNSSGGLAGNINLNAGTGIGSGGVLNLNGGHASAGNGGNANLSAGDSFGGGGSGGAVQVIGGDADPGGAGSGGTVYITGGSSSAALGGDVSLNGGIGGLTNGSIIFNTSAIERARIDAAGNFGIGTSTPALQLSLASAGANSGLQMDGTGIAPGVSLVSTGRIYFDSGLNKFQCSENASAYSDCFSATAGQNIYNTDGALTGGRTVTLAGSDLIFSGSAQDVIIANDGSLLVNTAAPIAGKVAVFNGDIDVAGIIDPYAIQFSGAGISGGYQIGVVTGATQMPIYVSPDVDSTDVFQVRGADDTTVVMDVDTLNQRVGVGTATPSYTLDVTSSSPGSYAAAISNTSNTPGANGLQITGGEDTFTGSSDLITFRTPNGTVMGSINQLTATTIAYNAASDQRLKENIVETHYGLDTVLSIEVSDYNFKSDPNQAQLTGFIAQQLYQMFPGAVTVGTDEVDASGKLVHPWQVDYSKLTPLLTKGIQDLNSKVDGVDARVAALETGTGTSIDVLKQLAEAKVVSLSGDLNVEGSFTVSGHINVGSDTAGTAKVLAGQNRVHVSFNRIYKSVPKVTITAHGAQRVDYGTENVSPSGFDIVIDPIQTKDLEFDWTALEK